MLLQSGPEQLFYILATNALKIGKRGNYHLGRSLFLFAPIGEIVAFESSSFAQLSPSAGYFVHRYRGRGQRCYLAIGECYLFALLRKFFERYCHW